MSNSLCYWFQDDSSNSYHYIIYTSQDIIDKVGYYPIYFEYSKNFSNYGPIIVIIFNKNKIHYNSYLYNNSKDEYWSNKIKLHSRINYDDRKDIKFNIHTYGVHIIL
jgi:hypothetical protein